jgi:hypothetical protein
MWSKSFATHDDKNQDKDNQWNLNMEHIFLGEIA